MKNYTITKSEITAFLLFNDGINTTDSEDFYKKVIECSDNIIKLAEQIKIDRIRVATEK